MLDAPGLHGTNQLMRQSLAPQRTPHHQMRRPVPCGVTGGGHANLIAGLISAPPDAGHHDERRAGPLPSYERGLPRRADDPLKPGTPGEGGVVGVVPVRLR